MQENNFKNNPAAELNIHPSLQEKRQSASRNLLQQLSQQSQDSLNDHRNPLLRSESSKDPSDERNNASRLGEHYETMDPLNVTEDDHAEEGETEEDLGSDNESVELPFHLDVAVDDLSHKISAIDLLARPISISSTSSSSAEPPNDVTQLVSTESQRSSMGMEARLNIIELPITKVFKKEVVGVGTTTRIEHRETSKQYEMTEDEDEEEEEEEDTEDEAITISDSSVSEGNKTEDPTNMAMSTINTVRANLVALSPDKMERMTAFLKDVSMEQRNLQECRDLTLDSLEYEQNSRYIELENATKARIIATADTESVTPDGVEDEEDYNTKSLKEKKERIKAFVETYQNGEENVHRLANEDTQDNSIMTDLQFSPSQAQCEEKTPQNKARAIANAETQDNSEVYSSPENNFDDPLNTPKPHDESGKLHRRLASAETEENTIMTEEMHLIISEPIYKTPIKAPNRRNFALEVTEENTQVNSSISSNEYEARKEKDNAMRLAHNETEANTEISTHSSPQENVRNLAEDETELNTSHSDTSAGSAARNLHKNLAQADTEVNTSIFLPSSPEMKTPQKSYNNSINSCISESPETNKSAPDHSITILETDEENSHTESVHSPQSNDNNKLSTSLHNAEASEVYEDTDDESDTDGQMSQIQMSMANINISAKINIKIHVTDSTEPSEDGDYSDNRRSTIESLPEQEQPHSDEAEVLSQQQQEQARQEKTPSKGREKPQTPNNKSIVRQSKTPARNGNVDGRTPKKLVDNKIDNLDDSCMVVEEDENFVDAAQKLLNQLYGNSWQTPDVIRTLKRTSGSADNTLKKSAVKKPPSTSKPKEKPASSGIDKEMSSLRVTDESALCDFSMCKF